MRSALEMTAGRGTREFRVTTTPETRHALGRLLQGLKRTVFELDPEYAAHRSAP